VADTVYRVLLSLESTGSFATTLGSLGPKAASAHDGVRALGEGARRVGEHVAHMSESVGGLLEGIADKAISVAGTLAKVGAGAVIGVAAYGVIHLNDQLEQTQIALGAIAQAQGFAATFDQGFAMAAEQVRKMKTDVRTLPGDLGQLSNIMKMIATPAAQGHATMDQIRELAGKTMLVATILGVNQEMAAREMANLFAGRAGAHNILGSRLGFIGDSAHKLHEASPEERVKLITNALDKYKGAADRFSQSFIANWTTLKDNVKYSVIAEATAPLFERVKHSMAEINTYFDQHQDKINELTGAIGRRLAGAWDSVEDAVKRVVTVAGPFLDRIIHMQPLDIVKKLEHGGELVLGTKIAGAGLSATGSILTTLMRSGMMAGGGGSGLAAGIAGAAPAIGVAAGVAAVGAAGLAGALDDLNDSTSIYHDDAVKYAEDIAKQAVALGDKAKPAMGKFKEFIDYLGLGMMQDVDIAMKAANGIASAAGTVILWLNRTFETFDQMEARIKMRDWNDPAGPIKDQARDFELLKLAKMATNERLGPDDPKVKQGAGGGGGGTHIQKVEIVVTGNDDPSRVARLTLEKFKEWQRNPRSSSGVAQYSNAR
jgi:hypothetical protein